MSKDEFLESIMQAPDRKDGKREAVHYPVQPTQWQNSGDKHMTNTPKINDGGLASEKTLRDYFAAMALHEITRRYFDNKEAAELAYKIADAMLAERERKP
jgi:hypothetical protein